MGGRELPRRGVPRRRISVRLVYAGQIDFYAAARARGTRLLQERYGRDINARTITVLIDAVIEVLQQIVRAELN